MGIYDRDYVRRKPPPGGGGAGFGRGGFGGGGGGMSLGARARMMSVTGWLIAINIAVFVIGGFLTNAGVPVNLSDTRFTDNDDRVALQRDFYTSPPQRYSGLVPPSQGRYVVPILDPEGAVSHTLVFTRLDARDVRSVSPNWTANVVCHLYVEVTDDGSAGRIVGYRTYRVMEPLSAFGHFSTQKGFFELGVWRLVTFQFLHSNLSHILFNMIGLWVFGLQVEQFLGRKKYLAFYLMCGISGGLLYLGLNLAGVLGLNLPGALGVSVTTPLIGASAGVFGVIMACAHIAPNEQLRLFFLPIHVRTKFFAYGYVLIAALNLFILKGANQGGDAAHVGGAIAGYYFIRRSHLLRDFFDVFQDSRKAPPKPARARDDKKMDRILKKISDKGMSSLTKSEKKFLHDTSRTSDDP